MMLELVQIRQEPDVVPFRNRLNAYAVLAGLNLINKTKLITAASELVRNMLRYAGGGEVTLELVNRQNESGVKLTFRDHGPGIADINQAMQDGFSTSRGLGVGLPGARRLVNEFSITSTVGEGTVVIITTWQHG